MKNICTNTKWSFIPDIIKEDFIKLAPDIDTKVFYNKNTNEIEEIYVRRLENVFFEYINDDIIFLIRKKYYDNLNVHVQNGLCRDLNLRIIREHQIQPFLIEYGNGFIRGYNEYEKTLKKDNFLFSNSDDNIRHKVYTKIKECKSPISLFSNTFDFDVLPQDECLLFKKDKTVRYILDNTVLFLSGIDDGEVYKAWEIILENPLLFEPLFSRFSSETNYKSMQSEIKSVDSLAILLVKEEIKEEIANLHDNMFVKNSFLLFDYLMKEFVTENRGRKDDISYCYRRMHKDELIRKGLDAFTSWFEKNYQEDLGKIKTLTAITNEKRDKLYASVLHQFNSNIE